MRGNAFTRGPKQPQIAKDTKVCILQKSDNLLYSERVVTATAVNGLIERITKYATKSLTEHGIKSAPGGIAGSGDATLVLELTTIESDVTSDQNMWTGALTSKQSPKITYSLTLTSPAGATLLNGEWTDHAEGLDNLCRKIGGKIGGRVAAFYKP